MILIIILSFILENIISIFLNQNSFFFPLFSLLSLIIIFYYNLKQHNYFILSAFVGLLYDIIFTDTLFLNCGIFLLFSLGVYLIFKRINYNVFNTVLVSLLFICLYRIITYLIFLLSFNISFNIFTLLKGIYSSIFLNIVYIILLYFIRNKSINSSK